MSHSELPFVQGELKHLLKRNKAEKSGNSQHPQHKTELNRLQNTIKEKLTYTETPKGWRIPSPGCPKSLLWNRKRLRGRPPHSHKWPKRYWSQRYT
ncbi:hypothetical protein TNIN_141671 [Trichonephila inaurata madagascariensis]|uniref:Uncharacterized protein n=1 Tax=Trichonephila inaurata madagascariensis TaxID=2747483 RepID=A0A8X6YUU9_9ARAC|nr:hypothetical protein TNIN_141671 [Trichonephila inaurata madagascariensis]